jgi:hypothetical protein
MGIKELCGVAAEGIENEGTVELSQDWGDEGKMV